MRVDRSFAPLGAGDGNALAQVPEAFLVAADAADDFGEASVAHLVGPLGVADEDGDVLMKLAREALESADLPDLQSLFADEVVAPRLPSPSEPTGSLLAVKEIVARQRLLQSGLQEGSAGFQDKVAVLAASLDAEQIGDRVFPYFRVCF